MLRRTAVPRPGTFSAPSRLCAKARDEAVGCNGVALTKIMDCCGAIIEILDKARTIKRPRQRLDVVTVACRETDNFKLVIANS